MAEAESQRLDLWLWCARVRRQRTACAALVRDGAVRVNRERTEKPDARVRVDDVLTLAVANEVRVLRIRALAVRRGDGGAAQALYECVPAAGCCPTGRVA